MGGIPFVMFVILVSNPGGSPRPVSIVHEFTSENKCQTALANIKSSNQNARIDLAVCTPK